MRIDAHQHYWQLSRGDYGWLTADLAPIYRDFMPDELSAHLDHHAIDGTIAVQAAPTIAETEFLLEIADSTPFVLGVVGWVDFSAATAVDDIVRLADHSKLVGLRPMIQDIADDDWMLRPELAPAFEAVIERDLAFDALVLPRHLTRLSFLLSRYPKLRTIVDHGAKPDIRAGAFQQWAEEIGQVARETNAYCKLSGLVTEARADWCIDDLRPYVDHLLDTFGPDRLIWGSDWPVCTLASPFERWFQTSELLLNTLSASDRAAIFGGNALRAYGIARD